MGVALERLLKRPATLVILRYFLGASCYKLRPRIKRTGCQLLSIPSSRHCSTITSKRTQGQDNGDIQVAEDGTKSELGGQRDNNVQNVARRVFNRFLDPQWSLKRQSVAKEGQWNGRSFTFEQLEFESDLDASISDPPKLVDSITGKNNIELWAMLLKFRHQRYGKDGILTIWKAMTRRRIQFPVDGSFAETFWIPFVDLALDGPIRTEFLQYIHWLYFRYKKRWPKLYVHVMQRLLSGGRGDRCKGWHFLLCAPHRPDQATFLQFMRNSSLEINGDIANLQRIYRLNNRRNAYAHIIPPLLKRQDFAAAFDWHQLLTQYGDDPPNAQIVEPLLQFLTVFKPNSAKTVEKHLLSLGFAIKSRKSPVDRESEAVSREIKNLVDKGPHSIGVTTYSDTLGARWFATTWVTVDTAISTIHALGVEEIGPLSLQSIALRESDARGVTRRIKQLQDSGISLGSSVYARAVESFAKNNQEDFLQGLLASDQHPDALEDWTLQEALLAAYAQNGNWDGYRRTLAIRLLESQKPEVEKYNITLRSHAVSGSQAASILHKGLFSVLEEMRMKRIPVTSISIRHILENILRPRQRTRRVSTFPDPKYAKDDLGLAISILTHIITHDGFVPILSWREILRRLGMLGRLDELDRLCLWLVQWYNPRSILNQTTLRPRRLPSKHIATSHPLHPLRILFSDGLLKAIVEWGFIDTMRRTRAMAGAPPRRKNRKFHDSPAQIAKRCCRGLRLLVRLQKLGVFVESTHLRLPLVTRLVVLYGNGRSNKLYNRHANAMKNRIPFKNVIHEIDKAWGSKVFPEQSHLRYKIRSRRIPTNRHPYRKPIQAN